MCWERAEFESAVLDSVVVVVVAVVGLFADDGRLVVGIVMSSVAAVECVAAEG